MNEIIQYYQEYDEEGRLFKDNSHKVEWLTTIRFLDQWLQPDMRILELGAATGRYTLHFAERGNQVDALELVETNIDILKDKLTGNLQERVAVHHGDARDLSRFSDNTFDAVLCMGPLYHLQDPQDKRVCIAEALRVLKPRGFLAMAYINKFASLYSFLKHHPTEFNDQIAQQRLYENVDGFNCFCYLSPTEISVLMEEFDVKVVQHIGTDGVSYLVADSLNQMNEYTFKLWMDYYYQICTEPSILGTSLHALYICRKG